MVVIGVTGPTGAGKTTVLRVLEQLGAAVLDCDAVYHDLLENCAPMKDELRARFGNGVFDENGGLRRKTLGAIVFKDSAALDALNDITHRYIRREVERQVGQAEREGFPIAALDAIALLESGLGELCAATVAVTAGEDVRVRRVMARDGVDEAYARLRVSAQRPSDYFESRCDYTLRNDGDDPAGFELEARRLFEKIFSQGGR